MPIKRVWIEEGCITCATSEEICPEVFIVEPDLRTATVREGVDVSKYEEQIKEAADHCPVQVIKFE